MRRPFKATTIITVHPIPSTYKDVKPIRTAYTTTTIMLLQLFTCTPSLIMRKGSCHVVDIKSSCHCLYVSSMTTQHVMLE